MLILSLLLPKAVSIAPLFAVGGAVGAANTLVECISL